MYRNRKKIVLIVVLLCLTAILAAAQDVRTTRRPQQPPPPKVPRIAPGAGLARIPVPDPQTSEKAIIVDPGVDIKACVVEGEVKVNGWERNEVRVFVKDGARFVIQVLEKDPTSGKPAWIRITGEQGTPNRFGAGSECLAGDVIEMDVPMKASLQLTGRVTETTVDSIRKVVVKNIGGNISLRHITGGIMAETYEGDVAIENSSGQISLQSSTGNIVAYEVRPGEIGDVFSAKTNNGMISLQKIEHRQIEANSVSGSVAFSGRLRQGGLYNFRTTNGAIKLAIPPDSGFKVIANYGFGTFDAAFPLKSVNETITPGGKNTIGIIGTGDSTVSVTTSSGSINIVKQN